MPAYGQFLFNHCPALAANLAGVLRVNCRELAVSVYRFTRKCLSELIPRDIRDGFRQKTVFHHFFNIQLLNADYAEAVDNLPGLLMDEVMPPVGDSFVNADNNLFNLLPFKRLFLLFGQFSLSLGKCPLIRLKKTRIGNFLFIGKGGKILQSNIYSDSFIVFSQRFQFIFKGKAGVPFVVLPPDGAGFDGSSNRAVKFNLDKPYLGNIKFFSNQFKPTLRKSKTVISVERLKPRIARLLAPLDSAKERLESEVNTKLGVLKALGKGVFKVWLFFFPVHQKIAGIVQRQRFLFFLPCFLAGCKRFIICPSAGVKRRLQSPFLFLGRIQSVFVCFKHTIDIRHICINIKDYLKENEKRTPYIPIAEARGFTA